MIRDHAMFMYLNSLSRLHQPNHLIDVASNFTKTMEELGEGDADLPPLPLLPPPPVPSQSQLQNDSNSNGTQQANLGPTPSRDKMHHCPTCLKPFRSKQQLSQHDLVHNGVRRHQCSYCDKCFKQLSHLQQHVRIHTGEKPYRCNVEGCERAFAQLSNLQHHLRNHDDQVKKASTKQFKCVICHRCYTNESSLKSHTLKMHIHIKPLDQQQVQDYANRQRKRKQKNPTMYNSPTMVPIRNRENGNHNDCVITRVDHNLDLRQVMRERQLSQNAQQLRDNITLSERQQNGQIHNSLFSNSNSEHAADDINSIERRTQRELLLHEPLASASLHMFSNQSISRRPGSTIPTSLGSLGDSPLGHHQPRDLYSPLPSHHIDHSTSPSPYPSLNLNVASNPYPAHINHINRHLSPPSAITPAHQHYDFNNSAMRLSHRLPHMMVSPMASNHMTLPTAPSRLLDTMPFSPLGN